MAQTRIFNKDITKPLTEEDLTLASGIDILNSVSGINNLGNAANPFGTIYADNIAATGIGGNFVNKTGDTMTGPLIVTGVGTNIYTATSGVGTIGSPGAPFNTIFVNNVVSTGAEGTYVNITGDTMTGPLNISNSTLRVGSGNGVSGLYAVAIGFNTQAIGNYSFAEGDASFSIGLGAHAEGYGTIASGDYSHSEGLDTVSKGINSHAEGNQTTAYGDTTHAEGYQTIASGQYSHAQGIQTTALGQYSHAEGRGTYTGPLGLSAHAEGDYSKAYGRYSHAGGLSSVASGDSAFAHGYKAQANHDGTVVFTDSQNTITATTTTDSMKLRFQNGIHLTSDTNLYVTGTIYAGNIVGSSASGSFVHTSGDTMTGSLNMSGSSAINFTDMYINNGNIGSLVANKDISIGSSRNIDFTAAGGSGTMSFNGPSTLSTNFAGGITLNCGGNLTLSPSGPIDIIKNEINLAASTVISGAGALTIKSSSISTNSNITPLVSSVNNIGSSGLQFAQVYAGTGNFHAISGLSPIQLLSDVMLASGVDFFPTVSGVNELGTAANPFKRVFADSLVGPSGDFLFRAGDTMYGNITLGTGTLGTNLLTAGSGTSNIGSSDNPFSGVYTDLIRSNNTLNLRSNDGVRILNGIGSPIFSLNDSDVAIDTLVSGRELDIYASSGVVTHANITPGSSGINLGSSGMSFGTLYVDSIVSTGITTSGLVHISGDTMTGNLIFATGVNILAAGSGSSNIGSLSLPFSGIYALEVNDRVVIVSKVNEVPSGTIDGANAVYTLTQTPYSTSLTLFRNGLLMTPSGLYAGVSDYSLSTNTITFDSAPVSGSILLASYGYQA